MRKFIASILVACMVLTTMCFTISAEAAEVKTDRAIKVCVDKTEVWAVDGKDMLTVTVVIEDYRDNVAYDDHFIDAEYTLNYDPGLFELQETEKDPEGDGTIYEMLYKTGIEGYNSGDVIGTYTFRALPQVEEETDTFYLTSPQTYTYVECLSTDIFEASTESKDVTIRLEPYAVKKYLDGNEVFDSDDENEPDNSFPYNNAEHNFRVETVPGAEVKYTVKNSEGEVIGTYTNEDVVIKAEGTYVIEYEVTNKLDGYAPVKGTYTIVVKEPVHVIEVVENYVLADNGGKVLVLVYTNTEGAGYNYDANVMLDVSKSAYIYDIPATTEVETEDEYDYVYAFVTDPIVDGWKDDFKAYKDEVNHWYNNAYTITEVGEYNNDINYSGDVTIKDISVVYGVVNAHPAYFRDVNNQKYILKADVSGDKHVNGEDASPIVGEVKNK